MRSHEIEHRILGDDLRIVEIVFDPGETDLAEAGAMNSMEDGIGFETRRGDGSAPDPGFMGTLLQAGKRAFPFEE